MNVQNVVFAAALTFCLCAAVALADVPGTINFQGTLTDTTGSPITGTRTMLFSLYPDSVAGGFLWSEIHLAVDVNDGLFSVQLGSTNPLDPITFDGTTLWLEIQVDPDTEPMSPRQPLVSVPYAFNDDQWKTSWDNAIFDKEGNVGIGTITPTYKLHVVGQAISGQNSDASGLYSTVCGGQDNTATRRYRVCQ